MQRGETPFEERGHYRDGLTQKQWRCGRLALIARAASMHFQKYFSALFFARKGLRRWRRARIFVLAACATIGLGAPGAAARAEFLSGRAWAGAAHAAAGLTAAFAVLAYLRVRRAKSRLKAKLRVAQGADLAQRGELVELTLNHMNQGVAVIRPDGRFWLYNQRALEYTGVDPDGLPFPATTRAVVEQQFRNGEFGPDGSLLPEDVRRFLLTGEGRPPKSYVRRRPNGVILEIRSDPMPDGSLIQTYTDITELARAKEAAEAAARAKSNFLAVMSHEIRTPLNGVLGAAQAMRNTPLDPVQEKYLQTIASCGEALQTLIDDILDLSRVESVGVHLQERPIDPREALRQAFLVTKAAGEAKGLRMAVEGLEGLPAQIMADGARLRQAVINLLGNAVKFTCAGGVTLSAQVREEAGGPWLRIVVRDTGVGVEPEALSRLFEPFEQGGADVQARFGGAGLGLSIVRAVVEAMGGRTQAQSAPGAGSAFGFEVPLKTPPAQEAASPVAPPAAPLAGPPRRVLVAEDVGTNQMVIEALLVSLGHEAVIVGDGAQALERLAAEPFDLVMLDMRMPVMDGLEAARRLRATGGPAARLPVVALTANAFPQDRAACRAAGMDDFISKPFDGAEIAAVIARLCPAQADRAFAPAEGPDQGDPMPDIHPRQALAAEPCEAHRCGERGDSIEGSSLRLCEAHARRLAPAMRARLARAARRRARLQAYWDDEAAYDAVVASGRYMKLAHASCCAEEHEEAARQSALLALLLAEGAGAPAQEGDRAPRRIA